MDVHSIRHAWFPPTIPKRKHDRDFDNESEWPDADRPLSEPVLEPRPTKRLRHIEGGLAKLSIRVKNLGEPIAIDIDAEVLAPSFRTLTNQPLDSSSGEAEPTIYEYESPHTGVGSSAASLPLRGEVYEANTSDKEHGMRNDIERPERGMRMQNGVAHCERRYTVHEPESGHEKRKREVGDDERGLGKKGKMTWYEPEKDRIVILDLDSSEDESVASSPRRRRSASSHSSPSSTRSRTQTQNDEPEYIINPALLSYIAPGTGVSSVHREDNPAQALVLYKPPSWAAGAPPEEPEVADIEDAASRAGLTPIEPSALIQGSDDAMDVDS